MKLIIENVRSDLFTEDITNDMYSMIKEKLRKNNITFNASINSTTKQITFRNVDDNKNKNRLFISTVANKIPIKNKELIDIKKRTYLNSQRCTEKQFDAVIDSINGTLNRLKVKADIKLFEYEDDLNSFITLRSDLVDGTWPRPTSFPVEV